MKEKNTDDTINIKINTSKMFKYIIMFIIMSIAIYYIPNVVLETYEIIMLGIISAIISVILDMFYPIK